MDQRAQVATEALALHRRFSGPGGELVAVGTPIRLDGARLFAEHLSNCVGEDTQAVLADAGFSSTEIAALAAQRAIAT